MLKKKSLGQNFLKDKNIVSAIVRAGDVHSSDVVVEVGPGEGVMTEVLLQTAGRVIAIEKDHRLIPILQEKFAEEIKNGKLELIEKDILDCNIEKLLVVPDLDAVRGGKGNGRGGVDNYGDENISVSNKEMRQRWSYKVVANIPYYITGQIIRMFLESDNQPETMVLLVQKEVAERIIARDEKESLLSLSVKIFGEPKLVRTVGRGAFSPQPNVDSAVLLIEKISKQKLDGVDEKFFFTILHAGFAHKRKQLLPNLSGLYSKDILLGAFENCGIEQKARAEDVPLDKWVKLCKSLSR